MEGYLKLLEAIFEEEPKKDLDIIALKSSFDRIFTANIIPEKLIKAIKLRYINGKTLNEVAKEFKKKDGTCISRERARQLINKGLRYLRHPVRHRIGLLKEYLITSQ
jgi:DNA-directed RNA polymerase sigma subunit (sigma70/sigma32)